MTVLVNIVGSPSVGKSTLAVRLFSHLKDLEMNVEFAPEYVKTWAWEGRNISPYDQFYIFGKEARHQSMLFNKVDVLISDSPVMLTAFYHYYYNNNNSLKTICHDFYDMARDMSNVKVLTYYLPRKKRYIQEGRYQSEEEADRLAEMLKSWLKQEEYDYRELDCDDEERLGEILFDLQEVLPVHCLEKLQKSLLTPIS